MSGFQPTEPTAQPTGKVSLGANCDIAADLHQNRSYDSLRASRRAAGGTPWRSAAVRDKVG